MHRVLLLHAFIWTVLSSQLKYDTYTLTGAGYAIFNEDQSLMVRKLSGLSSQHYEPLELYYRSTNSYQYAYAIVPLDGNDIIFNAGFLSGTGPRTVFCAIFNDTKMRVYTLTKESASYRQTITVPWRIVGTYYTAILGVSSTATTVFIWDNITQSYNTVISLSDTAKNWRARAISPDGAFMIQDLGLGTTLLYLYTYSGSNYTQTASYDMNPITTSTIYSMNLYQEGTAYIATVSYYSGGASTTIWLSVTATSITLIEQSTPIIDTYSALAPSVNGKFLIWHSGSLKYRVRYYAYNSSLLTFQLIFSSSYYSTSGLSLYSSLNGSFFSTTPKNEIISIHFICDVPNCFSCSFMGVCSSCASGYMLNGSSCICPPSQSLLSGACISCSIPLCLYCNPPDKCRQCNNGYILQENICLCPPSKTVSFISGLCVSCNIKGCARCDYDNTCSSFTDQTLKEDQIFLIVGMTMLLSGLIVLLVYLLVKNKIIKIHGEEDQQTKGDIKDHKEFSETKMKVSNNSEVKIQDYVERGPEELEVCRQRRKRVHKDKELQGISEVVIESIGNSSYSFQEVA